MTEIELLRKEFNERIDALVNKQAAAKFEVGKWYACKDDKNCLANFQNHGSRNFGFNSVCNLWATDITMTDTFYWNISTPEEIKSALVKEAEKRGFKEGVTKKNEYGIDVLERHVFAHDEDYKYFKNEDRLTFLGFNLYCKGVWAEIVKDQPIKMCGQEVTYPDRIDRFSNKLCKINDSFYTENELKDLAAIMNSHSSQIKSLNVGCTGQFKITLEDINKILKGFK